MSYEHKPNSGSIFPNDYKEHDRQPDWTGSAMIDGTEYRLAAWNNEGRNKDYISIKFQEMEEYKRQFGGRDRGRDSKTRAAEPEGYRERAAEAKQKIDRMRRQMADDYSNDDIPF